jgi:hypothetical protein
MFQIAFLSIGFPQHIPKWILQQDFYINPVNILNANATALTGLLWWRFGQAKVTDPFRFHWLTRIGRGFQWAG